MNFYQFEQMLGADQNSGSDPRWKAKMDKKRKDMAEFFSAIRGLEAVLSQLSKDPYNALEDIEDLAEMKNNLEQFLRTNRYYYQGQ